MSKTVIAELGSLVRRLNTGRQNDVNAIVEIDAAFDNLGVATAKPKKRKGHSGPPKTAKRQSGKRRAAKITKRREFKTIATELVLATFEKAGAKGSTGALLTKAWKAAK
ncbi:MAG TPA: hypothetical protein PKN33_08675 [Phycisphaerae bacterium]|nr:hypothetical protein [Phycisphaerae bacterium]